MKLPREPKTGTRRRNETTDLTHPIRIALNKLPGVRIVRNNVGMLEWAPGAKLRYGLGLGSADLVGIVLVDIVRPDDLAAAIHRGICDGLSILGSIPRSRIGRVFCLEVKHPGVKPDEHQVAWLAAVRKLGGFACVVSSIEEALAAVERCREGASG